MKDNRWNIGDKVNIRFKVQCREATIHDVYFNKQKREFIYILHTFIGIAGGTYIERKQSQIEKMLCNIE
jgi:hypothetical protein